MGLDVYLFLLVLVLVLSSLAKKTKFEWRLFLNIHLDNKFDIMSADLSRRINEKRQKIRQASISASPIKDDVSELSCLVGKTKLDQDVIERGITCERAIQSHIKQHGTTATLSLISHYNYLAIFLNGLVVAETTNREAKCLAKVQVQYRNYKSDSFIFKTRIVLVQYMLALLDLSTNRYATIMEGMPNHLSHCIAICHHFTSQLDHTSVATISSSSGSTSRHGTLLELNRDFYVILLDLLRARLLDIETYGTSSGLPMAIHKNIDTDSSMTRAVSSANNTLSKSNPADKFAKMTVIVTTSKCLVKNLAVWSAYNKMVRAFDKFEMSTRSLFSFASDSVRVGTDAKVRGLFDDDDDNNGDDTGTEIGNKMVQVSKLGNVKQAIQWIQYNEARCVKLCRDLTATCHGTLKFDKRLLTINTAKHNEAEYKRDHSSMRSQVPRESKTMEDSAYPKHVQLMLEQFIERALVIKIMFYRNLAKWYQTRFKFSNAILDIERGLLCWRRACGAMGIISRRACMSKSFEQIRGVKVSKVNQWLLSATNQCLALSRDNDLYYYTWPMDETTTSDVELLPTEARLDASGHGHSAAEACVKEWNLAKLQEYVNLT